jgi:hypothetical protein
MAGNQFEPGHGSGELSADQIRHDGRVLVRLRQIPALAPGDPADAVRRDT